MFRYATTVCLALLMTGCASTKISLKTNPPGADVVLINIEGEQKARTRSNTSFTVNIEEDFFSDNNVMGVDMSLIGDKETALVPAVITKENYLPKLHIYEMIRGDKNEKTRVVDLEKLNSTITLETDPPGAKIYFFASKEDAINFYNTNQKRRVKPSSFLEKDAVQNLNSRYSNSRKINDILSSYLEDLDQSTKRREADSIITPFTQKYTSNTVSRDFNGLKVALIEKKGYLPIVEDIAFKAGESNFYSFKLSPWSTKLTVISEPEGIEIEDFRKNTSFGYLGSTPLIRPFSYDEVSGERKDEFWFGRKIKLALRATKAGYEEKIIRVDVPFGEEITTRIKLDELASAINFQSEPPGSHVFVKREIVKQEYNSQQDKMIDSKLTHWKHLGVTPFTYAQDPSDLLEHKDSLKFSLPGYVDGTDYFKSSVASYHLVLEPKGQIINSNEIRR